jgi:hypothetical protein
MEHHGTSVFHVTTLQHSWIMRHIQIAADGTYTDKVIAAYTASIQTIETDRLIKYYLPLISN